MMIDLADARATPTDPQPPVRLAELVFTLSLATDLGMGLPLEHGLRTATIALRLGGLLGLAPEQLRAVYYLAPLRYAGCSSEADVPARFFGDEIAAGETTSHTEVAQLLADRLGLDLAVRQGLSAAYERWDGKGFPRGLAGEQLPLAIRVVQVAQEGELLAWQLGIRETRRLLRARSGRGLDPLIADTLVAHADSVLDDLDSPALWDDLLAAEPGEQRTLRDTALAGCLTAIADCADGKSFVVGHSRTVAAVAAGAGEALGLEPATVAQLYRAGLTHDIGRVAVGGQIWSKPGPLSRDEREQVRLAPYYTERLLGQSTSLRELGRLAAMSQERCDGSGYHRGLGAADIPVAGRVLATANTYQAMVEPRPYRRALTGPDAAKQLAQEASDGRLDRDTVSAVLARAGHQPRAVSGSRGGSGRTRPRTEPGGAAASATAAPPTGPTAASATAAPPTGPTAASATAAPPTGPTAASATAAPPTGPTAASATAAPPTGPTAASATAAAPNGPTRPTGAILSEREEQVLTLLANGLATKEIALALGISPKTADHHIQHIYAKIGVSTRAAAAVYAVEHGLTGSVEPRPPHPGRRRSHRS